MIWFFRHPGSGTLAFALITSVAFICVTAHWQWRERSIARSNREAKGGHR